MLFKDFTQNSCNRFYRGAAKAVAIRSAAPEEMTAANVLLKELAHRQLDQLNQRLARKHSAVGQGDFGADQDIAMAGNAGCGGPGICRSGGGAVPFLRDEPALGKQFDDPRHDPGFGAGLEGKTDGERKGLAVSVGGGTQRHGRRHREIPRRIVSESARPEPLWGPGR